MVEPFTGPSPHPPAASSLKTSKFKCNTNKIISGGQVVGGGPLEALRLS